MNNPTTDEVFDYIERNPGCRTADLCHFFSLSTGAMQKRVNVLRDSGAIKRKNLGPKGRVYHVGVEEGSIEQRVLACLDATPRMITEIATKAGARYSATRQVLCRLFDGGYLSRDSEHRYSRRVMPRILITQPWDRRLPL